MHPEFSRQIMNDHIETLRGDVWAARHQGRKARKLLRNPLRRPTAG